MNKIKLAVTLLLLCCVAFGYDAAGLIQLAKEDPQAAKSWIEQHKPDYVEFGKVFQGATLFLLSNGEYMIKTSEKKLHHAIPMDKSKLPADFTLPPATYNGYFIDKSVALIETDKVSFGITRRTTGTGPQWGNKQMIFAVLDFPDSNGNSPTEATLKARFASVCDFFDKNSFGFLTYNVTIIVGPLRTPLQSSQYSTDSGKLMNDGKTLMRAAGYEPDNYDVVGIGFPTLYSWGGVGGGGHFWLNGGYQSDHVFNHEIGHIIGLGHGNSINCDTVRPSGDTCHVEEYADYETVQGNGDNHYNLPMKRYLGWVEDSEILDVTTSGTYEIHPFDGKGQKGKIMGLKIPQDPSKGTSLIISTRSVTLGRAMLIYGALEIHLLTGTYGSSTQMINSVYQWTQMYRVHPLRLGFTYFDGVGPTRIYLTYKQKNCINNPCSAIVQVRFENSTAPNPIYSSVPTAPVIGWSYWEVPFPADNTIYMNSAGSAKWEMALNGPYSGFLQLGSPIDILDWMQDEKFVPIQQQEPWVSYSKDYNYFVYSNEHGIGYKGIFGDRGTSDVTALNLGILNNDPKQLSSTLTLKAGTNYTGWYMLWNRKILASKTNGNDLTMNANLPTTGADFTIAGAHMINCLSVCTKNVYQFSGVRNYYEELLSAAAETSVSSSGGTHTLQQKVMVPPAGAAIHSTLHMHEPTIKMFNPDLVQFKHFTIDNAVTVSLTRVEKFNVLSQYTITSSTIVDVHFKVNNKCSMLAIGFSQSSYIDAKYKFLVYGNSSLCQNCINDGINRLGGDWNAMRVPLGANLDSTYNFKKILFVQVYAAPNCIVSVRNVHFYEPIGTITSSNSGISPSPRDLKSVYSISDTTVTATVSGTGSYVLPVEISKNGVTINGTVTAFVTAMDANGVKATLNNLDTGSCDATSQSECTADPSCKWCSSTMTCKDSSAACTPQGNCTGTTSTACNADTTCHWCPTQTCLALSTTCPVQADCKSLNGTDACSAESTCHWCSTTQSCEALSTTCAAQGACTAASDYDCTADKTCHWCLESLQCKAKSIDCPAQGACKALFAGECNSDPTCRWCSTTQFCTQRTGSCFQLGSCSKSFAPDCESLYLCKFCPTTGCAYATFGCPSRNNFFRYGTVQYGYPNWQERAMLTLTNIARMSPNGYKNAFLPTLSASMTPATPLYEHYELLRSSRAHSQDMSSSGCNQVSSCDGTPASVAIAKYYRDAADTGIAITSSQTTPQAAVGKLIDSTYRDVLLNSSFQVVGGGYESDKWTQEFGAGSSSWTGNPMVSGTHLLLNSTHVSFYVNVYSSVIPKTVKLSLGIDSYKMTLDPRFGFNDDPSSKYGTYTIDLLRTSQSACRNYIFILTDTNGTNYYYPEFGALQTYQEVGSCNSFFFACGSVAQGLCYDDQNCKWCSSSQMCLQGRLSSCPTQGSCSATSKTTCTSDLTCQWCDSTQSCATKSTTCNAQTDCSVLPSANCTLDTTCSWCNTSLECTSKTDVCPAIGNCGATSMGACTADRTCKWCANTNTCASKLNQCPAAPTPSPVTPNNSPVAPAASELPSVSPKASTATPKTSSQPVVPAITPTISAQRPKASPSPAPKPAASAVPPKISTAPATTPVPSPRAPVASPVTPKTSPISPKGSTEPAPALSPVAKTSPVAPIASPHAPVASPKVSAPAPIGPKVSPVVSAPRPVASAPTPIVSITPAPQPSTHAPIPAPSPKVSPASPKISTGPVPAPATSPVAKNSPTAPVASPRAPVASPVTPKVSAPAPMPQQSTTPVTPSRSITPPSPQASPNPVSPQVSTPVAQMMCYGISSASAAVCNSHGTCIDANTCKCENKWYGKDCGINLDFTLTIHPAGTGMTISSPSSLTIASTAITCDELFQPTPGQGVQPKCRTYSDQGKIFAELLFGSGPINIDLVTINVNFILSRIDSTGTYVGKNMIELNPAPYTLLKPQVDISAPSKIGSCSGLRVDGSKSTSPDSRPTFSWAVSSKSAIADLETFVNANKAATVLDIADNLIPVDTTVTFTLTVTSALKQSSSLAISVTKDAIPLPTVQFVSTSFTSVRSRELRITPTVQFASCMSQADIKLVTFEWSQVSGSQATGLTLNSRTLVIPALTLTPGSYQFALKVGFKGSIVQNTISIVVNAQPLSSTIQGAAIQSVSNEIQLTATVADPDKSSDQEVYSWSLTKAGTAVTLDFSTNTLSLAIPKNTLTSGSYKATFTCTKGSRTTTSTFDFSAVVTQLPVVSIQALIYEGSGIATNKRLNIKVQQAVSYADGTPRLQWSSSDITLDNSVVASGTTGKTLTLVENSLTPGREYTFRVTATDSVGSSYAEIVVKTNSAPTGGDCSVSPSTGKALETMFTLSCSGWQDADTPLKYSISSVDKSQNKITLVAETQLDTNMIYLPAGINSNNELPLTFTIADFTGASTTKAVTVTVAPMVIANASQITSVVQDLSSTMKNIFASGDVGSASSMTLATIQLINTVGEGASSAEDIASAQAVKEQMIDVVSSLFISNQSLSSDQVVQAAGMLSQLSTSGSGTLSESAATKTLDALVSLASNIKSPETALAVLQTAVAVGEKAGAASSQLTSVAANAAAGIEAAMSAGDGANTVKVENLLISIIKELASELAKSGKVLSSDSSSTSLPGSAFGSRRADSSIGIITIEYSNNPYASKSSAIVASTILSVQVKSNGAVVILKNLVDPIVMNFTGTFNDATKEYTCSYWDTTSSKWSKSGCQTTKISTQQISCACDHATDFAIVAAPYVAPPVPEVTPTSSGTVPPPNNTVALVLGLVLGIGIPLLLIILAIAIVVIVIVVVKSKASKKPQQNNKEIELGDVRATADV